MLYRLLRRLFAVLFWIGRVKVIGRENLPATGGVIIAANHLSIWDPVVIAVGVEREISYMTKEEAFEHTVVASFLSALNAFPVKRGIPDRKAMKVGLEVLEQGKVVGIFPEGTRSKSGEISKPHHGVAMLALKGRVPIVPAACKGTRRFFPCGWFSPVKVIFGKPLEYDEYFDARITTVLLEAVSKDIMDNIACLNETPAGV